ncbi:MAG: hypothetical protein KF716_12030 [Anaerolineae bacterium]|nr:hypothetical protein [Anaerolineae bacterium]
MRYVKFIRVAILSVATAVMLSFVQPTVPISSPLRAQALTCSDVVKQALEVAAKTCAELGRNRACYANGTLTAQPKDGVSNFVFNAPGDVVAIKDLGTLSASPYDEAEGTWGVAMLRVQANLPGANVGQGVTMLAFGDTQVTDASADGTLQAFYLRTGVGQPGCAEMPRNGVLLESPTGEKVTMTVNGVDLKIGSTVYLFADAPEGEKNPTLWVHTLQGSVEMTSDGVTVVIPAGKQSCVPLRDDDQSDPALAENGPPCQPTDLDTDVTKNLPLDVLTEVSEGQPTPIPTLVSTAVPPRTETLVPPTNPPPEPTQPPPTPSDGTPPVEEGGNGSSSSNCQIDFFTAEPTSAFVEQEVQLSWSISGSVSFVQLIDPAGNPGEAATEDTRSYPFGTYQDGLPEGWTLQAFCTDQTSHTAGVTINPLPPQPGGSSQSGSDDNSGNNNS